ncbi:RIP metalloprotease RseP [Sphingorhabdus arenilitoris]|uniref:Zinc metalloprotease n=1 Tax=Sphingorhabdus arenilitoris TaxID=1490041 RepID=A0ABV8RGP9_9SPHN
MLESPNIAVTLFAFIILIGTLVVIHELGHYWVGRWFGVKAEKFSIGFGPQLWGRTDKRGTLWRIGALPLGGYVQFAGDMNPASQPGEEWLKLSEVERNQTFQSKALWKRALIVFAGPAINFLFAILLLTGFLIAYGQVVSPPVASIVQEGSAAERAGIQVGDRILSINGRDVESFQDLATELSIFANEPVTLRIKRGSTVSEKQVVLDELVEKDRFGNEYRRGLLGLQSTETEIRSVSFLAAPWIATKETANIVRLTLTTLGQIITGKRSVKELGGPAKIAKVAGEHFVLGVAAFIWLAAMISINLGFMNLLPIPMLDGGHLLLYAVEAVRRKPATPMVQEWAFRAGFVMLVGFMLVVTFNDLVSFGLFAG